MMAANGFTVLPGHFDAAAQQGLFAAVAQALSAAPLVRPVTRTGRPFSVLMSNMGPLGWVSDRRGYRYAQVHPVTGRPWPPIPQPLIELWSGFRPGTEPDSCLINFYRPGARMGMHVDRDEEDLSWPVVSVSLGDTAQFRLRGPGAGSSLVTALRSGDVCVLDGPCRTARHGIDHVFSGSSRLIPEGGRINLTLRRARG